MKKLLIQEELCFMDKVLIIKVKMVLNCECRPTTLSYFVRDQSKLGRNLYSLGNITNLYMFLHGNCWWPNYSFFLALFNPNRRTYESLYKSKKSSNKDTYDQCCHWTNFHPTNNLPKIYQNRVNPSKLLVDQ